MRRIILASNSPRRKKLLEKAGIKFEIIPANIDETIDVDLIPDEFVRKLSYEKAKSVAKKFQDAIVIGADTIVVFEDEILGKPKDKKHAKEMLLKLSGKKNYVITAFTIIDTKNKKTITYAQKGTVFMKRLTENQIEGYIKTGEPMDKAGAYAVQELGHALIEKTEGDYDSIVGLPVKTLLDELNKIK